MQTATEIAEAVRAGASTARAAVEQSLRLIDELDGRFNAFRRRRDDRALAEADAVDRHPGRRELPLAGVPIAIKGNVELADHAGTNDHPVAARLKAAGAVPVGLTNVPQLCVYGTTDSAEHGITRNPWQHERTPGGSSGGSAAAVAAGMVPVAHGNDGMGSIRIPAACTGLVGLKPGLGLVPSELGNGSWFEMAENGPLGSTVADCALLLSVLAGRPELAAVDDTARPRIGVSVRSPALGIPVDREFVEAARQTGHLLADAGHPVLARELRYPLSAGPAALARWLAGAELDAQLLPDRSVLEPRVARHAALGRLVRKAGAPRPKGRRAWQQAAGRYFEQVDVLVTPMLAQPPPAAAAWHAAGWWPNFWSNLRYAPFAAPWNLAGWPAMAVPAGRHSTGLPLSVQLVGRPGSEPLLMSVAARLEQLRPWPRTAQITR